MQTERRIRDSDVRTYAQERLEALASTLSRLCRSDVATPHLDMHFRIVTDAETMVRTSFTSRLMDIQLGIDGDPASIKSLGHAIDGPLARYVYLNHYAQMFDYPVFPRFGKGFDDKELRMEFLRFPLIDSGSYVLEGLHEASSSNLPPVIRLGHAIGRILLAEKDLKNLLNGLRNAAVLSDGILKGIPHAATLEDAVLYSVTESFPLPMPTANDEATKQRYYAQVMFRFGVYSKSLATLLLMANDPDHEKAFASVLRHPDEIGKAIATDLLMSLNPAKAKAAELRKAYGLEGETLITGSIN